MSTTTIAKGLYARVNDGNGKFPWVKVEIKRQHPVPVWNATSYFLRYAENHVRRVVPLGKDLNTAFIAWQNHEVDMIRAKQGKFSLHREISVPDSRERLTIAKAVQIFISENLDAEAKGKLAARSVVAYNTAANGFLGQVGVVYVDEITREVLLAHETWLHKHLEKKSYGMTETTVGNRFRYLSIFLSRHGIKMVKNRKQTDGDKGLLRFDEAPKQPKKGRNGNAAPDMYTPEELNKLLSVATKDEADLIQFFLRLGVRDGEAQVAKWTDIEDHRDEDDKIVHDLHIQKKPEFHWTPKDKEDRLIPIETGLYQRLMERRKNQTPKNDLIFPNSLGGRDVNLIHRLQQASRRAGLTKRPTLHKFRRTYASLMIGQSDLQTVQELLGHSDIKTTALYLAPDRSKARRATRTAFSGVGD